MKDFLFLALAAIALSSCADVSGALFAGGDGTYDFKNDYLDSGFQVDESKIHLLDLESGAEDTIFALYVGDFAQIATDTIVVYLHGNTPSMDSYWQTAGLFANLVNKHHYGFIMYDYRGSGWSTGRSTGAESMAADYEAVLSFLQQKGHRVHVISPNDYPDFLTWMPGQEAIVQHSQSAAKAAQYIEAAELIFTLDFNDLLRIDALGPLVEKNTAPIVMIDHHQNPKDYAALILSFPHMGSTAEIVYHIINQWDANAIDPDMASCG